MSPSVSALVLTEPIVSDRAPSADQTLTSGTSSNYHALNFYARTCKLCVTCLGVCLWSLAFYNARCPLIIFWLSATYFCLFHVFEESLLLPWLSVIYFWPHFFHLIRLRYQLSINFNSKPLPFVFKLSLWYKWFAIKLRIPLYYPLYNKWKKAILTYPFYHSQPSCPCYLLARWPTLLLQFLLPSPGRWSSGHVFWALTSVLSPFYVFSSRSIR